MKKILIFSLNYYPRFIGGAEVAIKEITDRISPEEIEFHLLTLRFDSTLPRYEQIGNVHVHRMGFSKPSPSISELRSFPLHLNKYLYQFFSPYVASRLYKKYHFDATWAMMAHSCGIPAGTFKKKHPSVPYLLTLQEGDPPAHIERMMKPVWKKFVRGFTQADTLQAISTFLLTWGMKMGFTGKGIVIPNAVDTLLFTKEFSVQDVQHKKSELNKKDTDVFLVTTSRLVHKNAVDDVLRALVQLPENISFLVYGIGPEEQKLRSLSKALKIEERVRFMGEISHAQLPLLLKACDIFIRPSRSEGMGNSFIEAMAVGLPVIATQEGGIADFLHDQVKNPDMKTTGWAVRKDTTDDIVKAVKDIVAHPQKVHEVTNTAKAMVIAQYDWTLIAQQMKEVFEDLFAKKVT